MNQIQRRGVTRGYVAALIVAATVLAASLIVLSWGMIAWGTGVDPIVTPGIPKWFAPFMLALVCAGFAWSLWHQALIALRGQRAPALGHQTGTALAGYLGWALLGTVAGLGSYETWLSVYAWVLVPISYLSALAFWAVLVRRLFSERPAPEWPWEKKERLENDGNSENTE